MKTEYPGIPAVADETDLAPSLKMVIEVVELLTGQRVNSDLTVAHKADLEALVARVKALEDYNAAHP